MIDEMESSVQEASDKLSTQMVAFLLRPDALEVYINRIEEAQQEIQTVFKVAEADSCKEKLGGIGKELELLIEIVGNLKIEDATQTTEIIERISALYSQLNGLRAHLKQKRQELHGTESAAEFQAQIRLLEQAMLNYLDLSDSPDRCEEYLTRLTVQLEELEGRFSEYEHFIVSLAEKREELYNAFEGRRLQLLEKRQKRATSLFSAAERILKGIANKIAQFQDASEINAYFATDLMVNKVRDIVAELEKLPDSVKAADIQTQLKTIREDAQRQLRDRQELFVNGANVIRLGRHAFSVSQQNLELSMISKGDALFYHLSGTNFFQRVEDEDLEAVRQVWDMSLASENVTVYRAEFLAWTLLPQSRALNADLQKDDTAFLSWIQQQMSQRYSEGYIKGIHDVDTLKISSALLGIEQQIGGVTLPSCC